MFEDHFPEYLLKSLKEREQKGLLRKLKTNFPEIDFCSNDYLGFSKLGLINAKFETKSKSGEESKYRNFSIVRHCEERSNIDEIASAVDTHPVLRNNESMSGRAESRPNSQPSFGSTGSRLISGNSELIEETEKQIAQFHNAESALIFNSGYDANVGLLSSVPKKTDLVLFDELCHASIYDGLRLSYSTHYKFKHNDVNDLKELIVRHSSNYSNIFIVVESVYSMDGDTAPLLEITELCKRNKSIFLVVDEAHAIGVFGEKGRGLCDELGVEENCFARVYTYGKAMGCHGAVIVGSEILRNYLINFARSFIYTTALPSHSIGYISAAYKLLEETNQIELLRENIGYFSSKINSTKKFIKSESAIHSFVVGRNALADHLENRLSEKNIYAKAIKSPTVKEGTERVRFCIHAFNTKEEIDLLVSILNDVEN